MHERVDAVAVDLEDGLVTQVEGRLVERRIDEARNQEDTRRIAELGVEIGGRRRLAADEQPLLLATRLEGHFQSRLLEAVLAKVLWILVDDALELERRQVARQPGHGRAIRGRRHRLDDLPVGSGLLERRAVARLGLHDELVDLVRFDGEDLGLLVRVRGIALRFDEVEVRAEAASDDEQQQKRSDSAHRQRLRHQVWMPARNTRPGRISSVNQKIIRS